MPTKKHKPRVKIVDRQRIWSFDIYLRLHCNKGETKYVVRKSLMGEDNYYLFINLEITPTAFETADELQKKLKELGLPEIPTEKIAILRNTMER